MKKFENDLKDALNLSDIQINKTHLQQTLFLARQELRQKPNYKHIKFQTFFVSQIRFIGWKIWAMQGFLLVLLCSALSISFGNTFLHNQRYVVMILCSVAILVLMTAIPFIHRALRYKMHEIELSTYFSSIRLLVAKLLIISIGDIFMLSSILFLTVIKTSLNIGNVLLYLLLPFLAASCGCLYLIGHISAERFSSYCTGMCGLLFCGLVMLNRFYPIFFNSHFFDCWVIICFLLLFFCIHQFCYIIYRSPYAEMQLV